MRRFTMILAAVAIVAASPLSALATTTSSCSDTPRLLVVSAFPTELGGIMKATALDSVEPIRSSAPLSKEFWTGTLGGKPVILALTGIGPVNAADTTNAAFDLFGDCITGVVFSGVAGAGAGTRIGDVTVPDRWTQDGGNTWVSADASMMATAMTLNPTLTDTNVVGDPACVCPEPVQAIPLAKFPYQPVVLFHGDGSTTDPFGGHAAPCMQHGGDVAGCEPCPAALGTSPDAERFATGMQEVTDPGFFLGLIAQPPPSEHHTYVEGDEETAASAAVATARGVPFIGFRAISDGTDDPLMLPGFPAQFFVYKQIASDNAAAMTLAFVAAWS